MKVESYKNINMSNNIKVIQQCHNSTMEQK